MILYIITNSDCLFNVLQSFSKFKPIPCNTENKGTSTNTYKNYKTSTFLSVSQKRKQTNYCILTSIIQAPMKATVTATTFTVNWNCKNLAILSYTFLPHMTAFTILVKLSSVRIISEASFATSVPEIP